MVISCALTVRPDGRVYDGEWENGKQHGVGTYTNAKGVRIKAIWQNGKKHQKLDDEDLPDANKEQELEN